MIRCFLGLALLVLLAGCSSLETQREKAGLEAEIQRLGQLRLEDQETMEGALRDLNALRAAAEEAGDDTRVLALQSQIASQKAQIGQIQKSYQDRIASQTKRLDAVNAKSTAEKLETAKFSVEKIAGVLMMVLSLVGGAVKL